MTILTHRQRDAINVRYCAEAYDSLVFDLKISSFKTECRNVLSLTHMVNNFISKSAQPDVFFNTPILKNFIKVTASVIGL